MVHSFFSKLNVPRMQLPTLDEPARIRAPCAADREWLEASRAGVVERLCACRREARAADATGWTALHWASSRGHEKAVKWLADLPDVYMDAASAAGQTALAIAAHRGHATIVSSLLQRRAHPQLQSKAGLTPLHHAAASCSVETVRHLLAGGASLTHASGIRNRDNSTPLSIATRVAATANGRRQSQAAAVVKLLEEESKRLSKWFRAARIVDAEALAALLRAGQACDVTDASGRTALIQCVRACRLDGVQLLIDAGADVNRIDGSGLSVLHHLAEVCAERHGVVAILKQLLAAGANVLVVHNASKRNVREAFLHALASHRAAVGDSLMGMLLEVIYPAEQLALRMRRWRLIGRLAGTLSAWHARAVERAYAPGGVGYRQVEADFEARAAKVQRIA
jgi:ankyrin repeat protein